MEQSIRSFDSGPHAEAPRQLPEAGPLLGTPPRRHPHYPSFAALTSQPRSGQGAARRDALGDDIVLRQGRGTSGVEGISSIASMMQNMSMIGAQCSKNGL